MKLPQPNEEVLDALVKVVEKGQALKLDRLDKEWWINRIHELQDFVISNGVRGQIEGLRPAKQETLQTRPMP